MIVAITGSNRGIGLSLTKEYVKNGHRVYALCRQKSQELEKLDNVKIVEGVDVTDRNLDATLKGAIGDEFVDVFINNAGILSEESLDDMDFDRIRKQFEVNTLGPINMALQMLPFLKSGSKIGVVTSRMGSVGDNHGGGYYGYRISKAAANAACKSLAIDLESKGIAVAMLHPGYVQTDMNKGKGDIGPDVAAKGLHKVMDKVTMEKTGRFWRYEGDELPW